MELAGGNEKSYHLVTYLLVVPPAVGRIIICADKERYNMEGGLSKKLQPEEDGHGVVFSVWFTSVFHVPHTFGGSVKNI